MNDIVIIFLFFGITVSLILMFLIYIYLIFTAESRWNKTSISVSTYNSLTDKYLYEKRRCKLCNEESNFYFLKENPIIYICGCKYN